MNLNIAKLSTRLPEAKIFRHLRIKAGLTTRQMSQLMECGNSLVTHFETGRNPLPEHRKRQLCEIFKITLSELDEYASGAKPIPINYKDECILLISKMDEVKLQSVYGILNSLASQN